jgi:hypothetical protein
MSSFLVQLRSIVLTARSHSGGPYEPRSTQEITYFHGFRVSKLSPFSIKLSSTAANQSSWLGREA